MTKTLAICVLAGRAPAQLDRLLQQLVPQVRQHPETVALVVLVDEPSPETLQVIQPYSDLLVEKLVVQHDRAQQLMAVYGRNDAKYIWAIPEDARVAKNAVDAVLSFLTASAGRVFLLNRAVNPLSCSSLKSMEFARLGLVPEVGGYFHALSSPACLIVPAGVPREAWPPFPAAEAHVYTLLRYFNRTPVTILGAHLVLATGQLPGMETWQRVAQWFHLLTTALVENELEGLPESALLLKFRERETLRHEHDVQIFYTLLLWLDSLWQFRRPLSADALIAYYRLLSRVATNAEYLLPLNRAAELCPGCEGLFHGHLQKQPVWVAELVQALREYGGQLQRHVLAPAHPMGYTLTLADHRTGELTQQELSELHSYLSAKKFSLGVEIGTQLGVSAVIAGDAMRIQNQDSKFYAIVTDEQTPTAMQALATLQQRFGNHVTVRTCPAALPSLTLLLAELCGEQKIDYAFISGLNRPADYVQLVCKSLLPYMAADGVIFLRNNPYRPLINEFLAAYAKTGFERFPNCGRPFGNGVVYAIVPRTE